MVSEFCFHLSSILTVKWCLTISTFSVTFVDMLFLCALKIHFTYILSHLLWLLMWITFRRNYYACPDDETFRFLASVYSRSHHNMSLSNEFQGGITNGAHWYCNLLKARVVISVCHFSYQLTEILLFYFSSCFILNLLQVPNIWWHARLELHIWWLFWIDSRD